MSEAIQPHKIIPFTNVQILENPGNGKCLIWSVFQGFPGRRLTNQEINNKVSGAIATMVKHYQDKRQV